jgi:hypothetical protein
MTGCFVDKPFASPVVSRSRVCGENLNGGFEYQFLRQLFCYVIDNDI